jgi:hypothetical protein
MLVQALVLSCGVLFFYWLARRILPSVMAFTAGLLMACSPWSAVYAGMPLTEGLFLLLLVSIFFTISLIERRTQRRLALTYGYVGVWLYTAYPLEGPKLA